jgi:protein-disulfide isomerase
MSPHHPDEVEAVETVPEVHHHHLKSPYLAAWIVAGGVVLGALIVSASLFLNFHMALKQLSGVLLAQNQSAGAPAVPAAATAGQTAPTAAPVNITLKPNTPYLGNANAKVTVVEFADYECPFCEEWYKTVWPDIKTKYVDTGKIKFVYQDFAFLGPDSNTAAEAAHCAADQNMFWQYHDYLFNNQGAEGSGWAAAAHQEQFAQAVGLNMAQFNSCFNSGKYKQEVLDETAAGKSYGVSGTPSIFINGSIIVGAQPAATFEQAIDAALNKS